MGSTAGTVLLLIVLAGLLAGAFVVFWVKDKSRADEESTDPQRIEPDPNAEGRSESWAKTIPGQGDDPGSSTG